MLLFLTLISLVGYSLALPFDNRVVNGTDADIGEFPFVASLRSSTGSHSCGCSIINSEWFLTAAHCVDGRSASTINIQYGVTYISATGPTVIKVAQIIKHEGFKPSQSKANDIAVIRVVTPIEFNDLVQPVKLPKFKQEFEHGTRATLIGWGYDKTGGSIQKHLQKVDIQTFSDEECSRLHNGETFNSNICGGVPEGGKGQCSGDSGGPLLVDNHIVGVVSWSKKPCTVAPYPGVYTKVSHFVDWINEKTGGSP